MVIVIVVWVSITGSLFAFNCDSPFNRGKDECKAQVAEHDAYMCSAWGTNCNNKEGL